MTKEDAIKELKALKADYWDDDGYGRETIQYYDTMLALNMAIEALEQKPICPSAGVDCEDCPAYEKKSEWEHDHEILRAYSDGASAVLDKVKDEIEKIPTAFATAYTAKSEALKIIDKFMTEEGKA